MYLKFQFTVYCINYFITTYFSKYSHSIYYTTSVAIPVKHFKLSLSTKYMMRTYRVIANTDNARTKALVMQPINNL